MAFFFSSMQDLSLTKIVFVFLEIAGKHRGSLSPPPPAYFAGVSLCSLPGEVLGVAEAQLHEPRHYDHDQGEHLRIREVVLHL